MQTLRSSPGHADRADRDLSDLRGTDHECGSVLPELCNLRTLFDNSASPINRPTRQKRINPPRRSPSHARHPPTYLYTEADVGDVKIDRDDRGEHDEAANSVLHEGDAAAPSCPRVIAGSLEQRNTRVRPDGEGHLWKEIIRKDTKGNIGKWERKQNTLVTIIRKDTKGKAMKGGGTEHIMTYIRKDAEGKSSKRERNENM